MRWANRFDVRLVARSGGHSYAGYSTTSDGVVLDLSALRGIRVAHGHATIGPAAQLIDVQRALARRGVTVPLRQLPERRIGGLALGGGHGLAGRRFGLTSDNLSRHGSSLPTAACARPTRTRTRTSLGVPRRRRRELRDRHRAHAADAPRVRRGPTSSSPGPGRRRARRCRLAAVRAARAARPDARSSPWAPPVARDPRGCRRSASSSAESRRCGGCRGRSRGSPARSHRRRLELLRPGAALGGLPRRRPAGVSPADPERASSRSPTTSTGRSPRRGGRG